MKVKLFLLAAFALFFMANVGATADDTDTERTAFFENRIRPLLAEHCYRCHSTKAKRPRAGLFLDSRAGLLKGGDSGPAVVPGHPEKSLLVKALQFGKDLQMPPKGKLAREKLALVEQWVKMGVPWTKTTTAKIKLADKDFDWQKAKQSHWAYRPIRQPALPSVKNMAWAKNAIDHFILAKLEANDLTPATAADRRVLIRRAYFDLIGLPPSPKEVTAFLKDTSADAFAKVVDRLLASPHYGERWGRHWLDVARYSDGLGGFLDQKALPFAWRYRDWVVAAMNRDLPYKAFVKQQIAGDLLNQGDSAVGPGFFAVGPTYRSDGGDADSVAQAKSETLDDRIDTLSRSFLALTVSCARCHDHKFDPITTVDYYALAGIFNNTNTVAKPVAPAADVQRFKQAQQKIRETDQRIKRLQNTIRRARRKPSPQEAKQLTGWRKELDHLRKTAPPQIPQVHTLTDTGSRDMHVALRGNLRKPGKIAPRRFLTILSDSSAGRFTKGSGRMELADAIADEKNPLTARVMVNRLWLHHFGKALVRTPSNFGKLGEPPTHPRLLDWLAHKFMMSGWSLKKMHRTIMLSATYRMNSRFRKDHFNKDGDNRLVWRMNPRRLEVEAWRDALLAVTGELDRTIGGAPVRDLFSSKRRTLYTIVSRNGDKFVSDEFLRLFDFPNPRVTSAKRNTSIVPQQYLFMMNSPFMIERAKALAARVQREATTDAERVERLHQLLYARAATNQEHELGLAFLSAPVSKNVRLPLTRWEQYAQVLLCTNEFFFVH